MIRLAMPPPPIATPGAICMLLRCHDGGGARYAGAAGALTADSLSVVRPLGFALTRNGFVVLGWLDGRDLGTNDALTRRLGGTHGLGDPRPDIGQQIRFFLVHD